MTALRPRILVTNDDGISSPGLHAVVAALAPMAEVSVVAPDQNRSGVSRSITLGRVVQVTDEHVPGAHVAFSTSGTPTDCVRLAVLGIAGPPPDLVVSGSNRGLNVGDDVAYSGTVSAAFDAAMNGLPAIAVSQQSIHGELGFPRTDDFDDRAMQAFLPTLVEHVLRERALLPDGLVVNVNIPGCAPGDIAGLEVGRLGRRIYRDRLLLEQEEDGRRHFALYGDDPDHHSDEVGTDIAAIGRRCIAITPLRFNAHDAESVGAICGWGLEVPGR